MKLKILNLNLWNYNNWEERRPKIIQTIKEHNPDVIVLQEVRDDLQFNKKGNNQLEQLNKELKYPYKEFYAVTDKQKERPEKYDHYCVEGTAILSKFPLSKIEKIKLRKHPDDRYTCGNLHVQINGKKKLDLIAVHFSNSDLFSLLHLIETLSWIRKKKNTPIIVGDFNMWHTDWLNDLTDQDYISSMSYKKYVSYPQNNNWTLDYILIPKKFKFKSLECLKENISDHKALVTEVEV